MDKSKIAKIARSIVDAVEAEYARSPEGDRTGVRRSRMVRAVARILRGAPEQGASRLSRPHRAPTRQQAA